MPTEIAPIGPIGPIGAAETVEADRQAALAFALVLADVAEPITMGHFRSADLVIETKPDLTEVTIADRSTEQAIRDAILRGRPGDGIVGEEHGDVASSTGSRWIVDPIDGTSNYTRGVPIWATLIAREHNGVLDVGVVSAPALGLRWWAAKGLGAYADGRRMSVSAVSDLQHCFLSYSESPEWNSRGRRANIDALRSAVGRERAFGDFWQHMMVAEGQIDIAAEAVVSFWDLAALLVIVEEAGGRFSDLEGNVHAEGGSAVSTNGKLHDTVLRALGANPVP